MAFSVITNILWKLLRIDSYQKFEKTQTKSWSKISTWNPSRSEWIQKNALLVVLKTETGTSLKLEWKFMTLGIFCSAKVLSWSFDFGSWKHFIVIRCWKALTAAGWWHVTPTVQMHMSNSKSLGSMKCSNSRQRSLCVRT